MNVDRQTRRDAERDRKFHLGLITHEEYYGSEDHSRELALLRNADARQFLVEHSKKFKPVAIGANVLIFADGSRIDIDSTWGTPSEPPKSKYDRLTAKLKYRELRYEKAEKEFREYRTALIEGGVPIYEDEKDSESKLKSLKDTAAKWRERVRKCKERRKAAEPFWMERKRQIEAENKQRSREHRKRIADIKL